MILYVVQVMRGYFPSILSLAQGLLRSTDCCVVPFGGHIYKQAFTAFDSYCQQVTRVIIPADMSLCVASALRWIAVTSRGYSHITPCVSRIQALDLPEA